MAVSMNMFVYIQHTAFNIAALSRFKWIAHRPIYEYICLYVCLCEYISVFFSLSISVYICYTCVYRPICSTCTLLCANMSVSMDIFVYIQHTTFNIALYHALNESLYTIHVYHTVQVLPIRHFSGGRQFNLRFISKCNPCSNSFWAVWP
jgi:hypothetical protein